MSENYFYSSLSGQEIEDTLLGSVRGDVAQSRSNAWKAQARQNIGAGSEATGFQILGYYDTLQDLIDALQVLPQPGDAYGIGTQPPYHIYVYDGTTNTWLDNGTLNVDAVIDDNATSSVSTWSSSKINSTKQDKITAVGILKGSGSAVFAATIGTDYTAIDDTLSTSTTKTYSIDKIKSLEPSGIVHYDQAQTLTDAQKAQARSNIQAAGKWTLLWTNPSPTSSFSAQTASCDLTGITEVWIEFNLSNTNNISLFSYARTDAPRIMIFGFWNGKYVQRASPQTGAFTSTGIAFDVAISINSYGSAANTQDNSLCVPIRIFGR